MSTLQQQPNADTLRREMAQVRHELSNDVEDVVDNARELANWRHYVRKYPYICVGAALAVGYLVIPQRIEIVSPSAKQLEKLAERDHLVVKPSATAGRTKKGWKTQLLNFGANLLVRSALTYAGQRVGKLLGEQQSEVQAREDIYQEQ